MSHLRAPATRADRREGGRHGRPVARPAPASAETHIRPQLLRLAVLPPTAVALSACAVVLFTVRSTHVRPGVTLWAVLAGAVAVTGVGIVIAAVAADRAARSVSDRVAALRRGSARGEAELRAVIEALRRGEVPPRRTSRGGPPGDADDFELLAADLARAHEGAVTAVVQAAQLSSQAGSEQKLEVFVNLARRLQSLVHREISILDELENAIEDPDLLKGLFHVDHLATRIRRHAENLAVLGGAVSRRQWSNPVSMTEVLRSAIAEVEQYARVKLVPPIDGELRGHAVADVIHLLAELVENATVFSAPHTQVLLRANLVTSGLAVEVEDRGLGMPVEEQSRMNALLADPDQVNVGRLLADGRIGLFVVSQLARRHGIRVRLQSNIYGGVQAVLVVPQALLGSAPGVPGAVPRGPDSDGGGLPLVSAAPPAPPAPADPVRPPLPPAPQSRAARTPDPGQPRGLRHTADVGRPTGFAHPQDEPGQGGPSVPSPGRDTDGAGRSSGPARAQGGGARTGPSAGSPEMWNVPGTVRNPTPAPAPSLSLSLSPSPAPAPSPSPAPASSSSPSPASSPSPSPASSPTRGTPGSGVPVVAPLSQGHPSGSGPAHAAAPPPHPVPAEPMPQRPGAPAPLPVRGARAARPNPAEAVPGIRRGDRPVVEEHAGIAPTPRVGAVRGTMGKPQLPRRRAQEHLVPQLRGGPAPRQDFEQPAGHDPGLMAAFQRGIGLAEAQQSLEADVPEAAPPRPPAPLDVLLDPAAHPASDHGRRPGSHGAVGDAAPGGGPEQVRPAPLPVDADVRPPHPSRIPQARPAPAAAPPEAYGAGDGPDLPGPERSNARHDGSAPAG
ncbi:sensor histidine kinase [Streptomyces sp. NPDC020377]|uniref:sensor histidine kinase n=1 Tax=Streptomyces sp. NPDC020377 TaxID=3365070 RepID=UPI00378A7F3A